MIQYYKFSVNPSLVCSQYYEVFLDIKKRFLWIKQYRDTLIMGNPIINKF